LARVLRKRGDLPAAIAASSALASLTAQEVDGVPATLAGLDGQRLALAQRGDVDGARRVADDIRQRLDAGEWLLDRGTAEFYRDEVSATPRPDAWLLAAAISDAWNTNGGPSLPSRGLTTLAAAGRPILVAWRANADAAALEAAFAARFLATSVRPGIAWRLADADDHHIAGEAGPVPVSTVPANTVDRVIGGGSSWTVRAWSAPGATITGARREPMLIAATAGTLLFLWAAAGLMARALTREARVAQLQTDFVAAVSHEFRSPLTTMRQMAEMLDTDRVPDEARRKQYYHVLAGETTRLQRLVERLLDFGRMEAGHDDMRREHLDVATLVNEVVGEMRESATERGGRIEVVHAATAVHVQGDAQSLRLAIRNLVENAVKYSPGLPDVTVRVTVDRGRASVAVGDTGLGIDRDEQRTIFGKFVRGRAAAATRVRGTGVGLAAVKHVVDAHGGAITLESEPGRGSTFTLLLPLDGSAAAEAASSAPEGSEA
jgi:signal transduction histidine kinase